MTDLKSGSSRKWPGRRVALTWLVMTLIAVLISVAADDRMRRGVFDSWQTIKPRDLSETDVRVVMIDDESIDFVGAWPWPRYYLARLAEELTGRGAKVIGYDIVFAEHEPVRPENFVSFYPELSAGAAAEIQALEPMDGAFGKVIGKAPVVLAHAGVSEAPENQVPLAISEVKGKLPPEPYSWPAELSAIPELDDVALGHGLINVRPDSDGIIRTVPLVMLAGGKPRPGFALEIARNTLEAQSIEASQTKVKVGPRVVPVDRHARMWLHFGTFPPDKIVAASRLIGKSKQLPADLFSGKPVVIGLSAEGTFDVAATSRAAEEFGPLVQAQAVDAILRGGWLQRPHWATIAEWSAAVVLALLAFGNAFFGRPYRIFLAVIFVAVPLGSWLAFANAATLIDPARPLLVGGGAVAGVAMGLFALARADRERLREALLQERIVTAATEGELQAARAIQLGMVPPRDRLRGLDPRIDVDALLEPARSIGGDYYDAMKIGDDEFGFAIADVTGKGVPAALFMAMSKALTSAALSRMAADPATMITAINDELLKDSGDTMSVTMILGILDLRTGAVRMACAGHEDPLMLSPGGSVRRVHLEGGLPLCIMGTNYPLESVTMQPGETLLLVTDGVTEAQDSQGKLFGRDRILPKGETAMAVIEAIRDQVRAYEAGIEATDDLTVMAIRYLG